MLQPAGPSRAARTGGMPAATLDVSSAGGRVNMPTEKIRVRSVTLGQPHAISYISVQFGSHLT